MTCVAAGTISKNVVLNADKKLQTMDGFGVNITPAQWRDGNLKPVLDMLVDDLGCKLFQFDCCDIVVDNGKSIMIYWQH